MTFYLEVERPDGALMDALCQLSYVGAPRAHRSAATPALPWAPKRSYLRSKARAPVAPPQMPAARA